MDERPWRLPVGAEIVPGEGVHFRVWAPKRKKAEVVLWEESPAFFEMRAEGNGYFEAVVPPASAGSVYKYRLDEGDWYPDPASRFQPRGPHHFSEVIDPSSFEWTDSDWRGVSMQSQVLYEMHIGTFTPEGTFSAAERELLNLRNLGITAIEVMPIAEFPGEFGWGYDGVHPYAPTRLYGRPDDVRHFVDAAHGLGLAVILDVVYNHL
ncbi:MAG: alpha-amylase family glycosyl hydrolase, partial [Bryobacteraceae bacterium]